MKLAIYAKPKDFEFIDETHAVLVAQNKYDMEANYEKLQNADCANSQSGSDGGMLEDINNFIWCYSPGTGQPGNGGNGGNERNI